MHNINVEPENCLINSTQKNNFIIKYIIIYTDMTNCTLLVLINLLLNTTCLDSFVIQMMKRRYGNTILQKISNT